MIFVRISWSWVSKRVLAIAFLLLRENHPHCSRDDIHVLFSSTLGKESRQLCLNRSKRAKQGCARDNKAAMLLGARSAGGQQQGESGRADRHFSWVLLFLIAVNRKGAMVTGIASVCGTHVRMLTKKSILLQEYAWGSVFSNPFCAGAGAVGEPEKKGISCMHHELFRLCCKKLQRKKLGVIVLHNLSSTATPNN
jgi:hypothetical protein